VIRWILAVSLAACGQGGPDRVLKFGPDPAQDAQIAACADLAPATPTRPQPAERSRPAVPHFDALDGGAQAP
jgi:predicted small lipoprotein YifL